MIYWVLYMAMLLLLPCVHAAETSSKAAFALPKLTVPFQLDLPSSKLMFGGRLSTARTSDDRMLTKSAIKGRNKNQQKSQRSLQQPLSSQLLTLGRQAALETQRSLLQLGQSRSVPELWTNLGDVCARNQGPLFVAGLVGGLCLKTVYFPSPTRFVPVTLHVCVASAVANGGLSRGL